jgi:DNA-binding MarR family transcriptional regulator
MGHGFAVEAHAMRSNHGTTPGSTAAAELLQAALDRLELATIRHRGALRRRLDVSDEELTVLLLVAADGDVSLATLMPLTGLSRSGTGVLVQRLERAGLVERFTHRADRRVRRIRLSRSGARRMQAARAGLTADLDRLVAGMTSAELVRTRELLERVADAAAARGGSPAGPAPPPAADPAWRLWG